MINIFTCPKSFHDPHIRTIQTNAILSWINLGSQVEISLIGNDGGVRDFAKKYQINHLEKIKTNRYGTPLVNSLLAEAEKKSPAEIFIYINADIVVFDPFIEAIIKVKNRLSTFLMIGQRTDLDWDKSLDFSNQREIKLFQEKAETSGKLHPISGVDYFIYPRGFWKDIPDLALGRDYWDNWLVYYAKQKESVIDLTPTVQTIHQNHDYSHTPKGHSGSQFLEEQSINRKLTNGHLANVIDADYKLTHFGLIKLPPIYQKLNKRFYLNRVKINDWLSKHPIYRLPKS
jgi:hypothetical protein